MPKVAVLSLGGTIAMGANAASGGVTPSLSADDLIAAVPELSGVADLEAIQICNLPSPQISLHELSLVISQIRRLETLGFDGVVITQGTDTIEETCWVLDLVCRSPMGLVVTGAMRNPTLPGADGPANLLAAVQVAASDAAKVAGTLVVFNDQIHAARFVQKTHTSNVGAFTSPSCGPVGWMAEGNPVLAMQLLPLPQFDVSLDGKVPWVPIIKPGLVEDSRLVRMAGAAGIDGLVFEASGGGHTTPALADALELLARNIPVALSSRTRAGSVLTKTYGFSGSERDLLSRGLIATGYLDACKARIVLLLVLMSGQSVHEMKEMFLNFAQSGQKSPND
jgi:L-asparaginase